MPEGNPLIGEVWEMQEGTGRSIRGVIAELSEHVITLVSFTGNRFRTSPAGLTRTWRFSQDAPPTTLRCNRRGCLQPGTMRFQRGNTPEWVCPRHLPVGVQASITTESLATTDLSAPVTAQGATVRCPGCALDIDPVEDARLTTPDVTFWQCLACNERWGSLQITGLGPERRVYVREALARFISGAERSHVTIRLLEAVPTLITDLMDTPELALTGPLMYTYLGFPITPRISVSDGIAMIIRTSGAPLVQPEPQIATRPMLLSREAWADLLRADRAIQEAERRQQGVEASYPIHTSPEVDTTPARFRPPAQGTSEGDAFIEEQMPTQFASVGQRWTHRGDLVEITRVARAEDGSTAVHFARVAEGIESNSVMMLEDFLRNCKPFTPKSSLPVVPPSVEVLKDEEWEHVESGEVVKIDTVDSKRDLIIVTLKDTRRRSVPLYEFINAKWRKIVRRTAYDRLLNLEDD